MAGGFNSVYKGLICHVVGFVCSTLQEIKQIFCIMYLFDMFSDTSNEWLNTDVRFS